MKNIILTIVKLIFFSYTFYLFPLELNFFLLIFLAFTCTIIYKHFAFVILIVPLLLKEYQLTFLLLGIIATSYFGRFYTAKSLISCLISFGMITIFSTSIFLYLGYFTKEPWIIALYATLSIVFLFIVSFDLAFFTNIKGLSECYIINQKIFGTLFLALSYASILLTNPEYSFLMVAFILIYLRYLTDQYTYLSISILNLIFAYLFLESLYLMEYFILFVAFLPENIFCILAYLLYRGYNSYINNEEMLKAFIPILIIFSIYLLVYQKTNNHKNTQNDRIKRILDDYALYLDIVYKELSENDNSFLIEKRINDLITHFCLDCPNCGNCLGQGKVLTYNYFKLVLTREIDINTINLSSSLKKFILSCPHYIEFSRLEKIEVKSTQSYESIMESKNLISLLSLKLSEKTDYELFNNFSNYLINLGYQVKSHDVVFYNKLFEVYLVIEGVSVKEIENLIARQASHYFKRKVQIQIIKQSLKEIVFKLYYKPNIKITFDHYSLAKSDNTLPGDNFMAKKDSYGRYVFALSDGMGSGYQAFNESSEMLRLVREISNLNFDSRLCIDLLDSYYAFKNNKDIFATLDFLQIDSVNCEANLFKLGATNTYLLSKGDLKIFYNKNLPLGLKALKDEYHFPVNKQDLILMVSDGVTEHTNSQDFQNFLLKIAYKPVNKIVQDVIDYTLNKQKERLADDLSVIAIKIA